MSGYLVHEVTYAAVCPAGHDATWITLRFTASPGGLIGEDRVQVHCDLCERPQMAVAGRLVPEPRVAAVDQPTAATGSATAIRESLTHRLNR